MKRFLSLSLCSILWLTIAIARGSQDSSKPETTSAPGEATPVEPRCLALETAGAFTNDGFRIRDAEWPFRLTKGTPVFLRVTLFAGNRYWFVAATSSPGAKLRLTLYDGKGQALKTEHWQESGDHGGSRTAAGIASEKSGLYFVGVKLLESASDLPLDCSLVITYK